MFSPRRDAPTRPRRRRPNWAEQSAEDWWNADDAATREVVAALGATSDRRRRPVRPAQRLCAARRGRRAAPRRDRSGSTSAPPPRRPSCRRGLGAAIEAVSGNAVSPISVLPKLLWMQRHRPELLAKDAAAFPGQGLHPLAAHRRACHRPVRRLGHQPHGPRRRAAWSEPDLRRGRHRPEHPAGNPAVHGDRRPRHRRGELGDRPPRRHAGRAGRRRRRGARRRLRRDRRRRARRDARHRRPRRPVRASRCPTPRQTASGRSPTAGRPHHLARPGHERRAQPQLAASRS